MVVVGRQIAVSWFPYRILGEPRRGSILIIGDHASNHVPADIDLGIEDNLLADHIAWDIGVAEVCEAMVNSGKFAGYLGNVSRLVVDLNRYAGEAGVIPATSDGISVLGNEISNDARQRRVQAYHQPYHDRLADILTNARPALILSLHSFTPQLASRKDEQRPWEVGILYNEQEAPSKAAIGYLAAQGLMVGDQQPYSGKLLNATMNRHAEGNNIPYIGVEMRQDLVNDAPGRERFAQILANMCHFVSEKLGLTA
jgi:predicted N-formylglutamate amidohydrolase